MLVPERITIPLPSLVKVPVLMVIGSATVILPAPPKVKANVPVIPLPDATSKVKVPASELILAALPNVMAPVSVLLLAKLRSAPPVLTPVPLMVKASAMERPLPSI